MRTTQRTTEEMSIAAAALWEHLGRFFGEIDIDLTTFGPGIADETDALVLATETQATVMERVYPYLHHNFGDAERAAFFRAYQETTGAAVPR